MSEIDAIVQSITSSGAEKIILFGSHAYGSPHADSDLDLAVIKKTTLPFLRRITELRRIIRTKTPIDLLVFTPEEFEAASKDNTLVREISDKGKVLYAR